MQRAIVAGQTIPTPEVTNVQDNDFYNKNYPADYKMPRQMIHMQRKFACWMFVLCNNCSFA